MMVGKYSTTLSVHVKSTCWPQNVFHTLVCGADKHENEIYPLRHQKSSFKRRGIQRNAQGNYWGWECAALISDAACSSGSLEGEKRGSAQFKQMRNEDEVIKKCEVITLPVRRTCLNGRSLQDMMECLYYRGNAVLMDLQDRLHHDV